MKATKNRFSCVWWDRQKSWVFFYIAFGMFTRYAPNRKASHQWNAHTFAHDASFVLFFNGAVDITHFRLDSKIKRKTNSSIFGRAIGVLYTVVRWMYLWMKSHGALEHNVIIMNLFFTPFFFSHSQYNSKSFFTHTFS